MIDFRYHLVSIVGIFLALAVGLVLGTTQLNPILTQNLRDNVHQLTADKQSLRDQLSSTQQDLTHASTFISAVEKPLIAGRLTGHRVLLVTAPAAPSSLRKSLAKAVADSGGLVTGELAITADYLDPANQTRLGDVVNSVAPATVTLPQNGTSGQRAAQLLASLLLAKTAADTVTPETSAALTALTQAKFVQLQSATITPADLMLVLSDDAASSTDKATPTPLTTPAPSDDALLDLVGAADSTSNGVVVAGTSNATKGTLLSAVRASGTSDAVSTVDSADSAQGDVQVIFALAGQLRGDAGSYGANGGADLPVPTLVP